MEHCNGKVLKLLNIVSYDSWTLKIHSFDVMVENIVTAFQLKPNTDWKTQILSAIVSKSLPAKLDESIGPDNQIVSKKIIPKVKQLFDS